MDKNKRIWRSRHDGRHFVVSSMRNRRELPRIKYPDRASQVARERAMVRSQIEAAADDEETQLEEVDGYGRPINVIEVQPVIQPPEEEPETEIELVDQAPEVKAEGRIVVSTHKPGVMDTFKGLYGKMNDALVKIKHSFATGES